MYLTKIYLKEGSDVTKVRIVKIRPDTSFSQFSKLINELFDIGNKLYNLYWTDAENDLVTVSNSTEFQSILAMVPMPYGLYAMKFTIQFEKESKSKTDKDQQTSATHINITCDGCGSSDFSGFRYKCLECTDYDLCSTCENAGMHPHHFMMRIPKPMKYSKHLKHLYEYARHFARKFSYENDEKNEHSHRHRSHHAFNRKGSCRANRKSCGTDTSGACVFKDYVQPFLNSLGIDLDIDGLYDSEDCPFQAASNTNQADPVTKSDAEVASKNSDKQETDKEEKINKDDAALAEDNAAPAADTTSVEVSKNVSAAPDTTEEWTIINKSSSSNSASTHSSVNENSDVTNESKEAPTAPEMNLVNEGARTENGKIHHSNPKIQNALEVLMAMGITVEPSVLIHLLEMHDANIQKVLDIVLP